MSTIQRYERVSPEVGDVPQMLSKLARQAREHGRDDIADAFEEPIRALLSVPSTPEPSMVQLARRLERLRAKATPHDWDTVMGLISVYERLSK